MLPIPGTLCMATWASQEDWVLGSGSDLVQKAWVVIHLGWIFQAPQERQPSHWTSQDGSLSTQHRFLINWAALQRRWRLCCWTLLVVRPSSCTWASEGGRARWALGQHVSNIYIYIYDTHNFAWFFTEIGTYTAVLTRVRVRVSWHNSMLLYAICPPLTRDEYRYMLPFWCSGPPVVWNLLFFWVINCAPIPLHRWPLRKSMVKSRACRNWHASPFMQPPVLFDSELTFANDLEPNQGTEVGEWQGYALRAGAWSMEKKMCSIKGTNDDRWPNVFSYDLSRAFAIRPWDRGPEAPSTSASWPIDAVWGDDVGKAQFH